MVSIGLYSIEGKVFERRYRFRRVGGRKAEKGVLTIVLPDISQYESAASAALIPIEV
jgi:hypothetical protein